MNKHCYRIIFNRERGQLMVVSELANRNNCITTTSSTPHVVSKSVVAKLKPLCLLLGMALGNVMIMDAAVANIVADNSAAAHQQPQIIRGDKGPTIVNIQAPDKNGFSHNKYTQFDVDQKGAILNNSQQSIKTELAGRIDGNTNLAGGEAQIILNEVNSRDPSKLNGYIEVAGKKAQVIIANPSGIACDGCGFINANKATLTTGSAQIEDGQLKGYTVRDGAIVFTGKGLNNSKEDYTEIIARSVEVNAGIHGKDIKVITGVNRVSADLETVSPIENKDKFDNKADDNSPKFAVDVSALGGMYAGKIYLIGTEKGVGVNNAGQIKTTTGDITLTMEGRIINTGGIQANENIRITSSDDIKNDKQIKSITKNIKLASNKTIVNTGVINALNDIELNADTVNSSSNSTLQSGLDKKVNGNIIVTAKKANLNGKNIATKDITVTGVDHASLAKSKTRASALTISGNFVELDSATFNAKDDITIDGKTISSTGIKAKTLKNYRVEAKETFTNDNSNIEANGDIVFVGGTVNNNKVQLTSSQSIKLITHDTDGDGLLYNNQTKLTAQKGIDINVGNTLFNNNSQLITEGVLQIKSQNSENKSSILKANGDIIFDNVIGSKNQNTKFITESNFVANGGWFDNTDGLLTTKGDVLVNSDSDVNITHANVVGNITVNAAKAISIGESDESSVVIGALTSEKDIKLTAGKSVNIFDNGIINANGKMAIDTEKFVNAINAQITTGDELVIRASQEVLNAGNIKANGPVIIDSGVQFNHLKGNVISHDKITINALIINNDSSSIETDSDLTLHGVQLKNTDTILSTKGDLNLLGTVITNKGGDFQTERSMNIVADNLDNTLAYLKGMTTADWTIDEVKQSMGQDINEASISIDENLLTAIDSISIKGASLAAAESLMISGKDIQFNINELNIQQAKLNSVGNIDIQSKGLVNAKATSFISEQHIKISADKIDLTEANLNAIETIDANATSQLINTSAEWQSKGNIIAKALDFDNQYATITTDENIIIDATQLNNSYSKFVGQDNIVLTADDLTNQNASFTTSGDITLNAIQLDNKFAHMISQSIIANAENINNINAILAAEKEFSMTAHHNIDNTDSILSGSQLQIKTEEAINNQSAILNADNIQLQASTIDNQHAFLVAEGDIKLNANQKIDNQYVDIRADKSIAIDASEVNNQNSRLTTEQQLTITADILNSQSSNINAMDIISINAKQMESSSSKWQSKDILITSDTLTNQSSTLNATSNIKINADKMNNDFSSLMAEGLLNITANDLSNKSAVLTSGGDTEITASHLDNQQSKFVSGNELTISSDEYINNSLAELNASGNVNLISHVIDNQSAVITSDNSIQINSKEKLSNQSAILNAKQDITVKSPLIENNNAKWQAGGVIEISTETINNQESYIEAKKNITIEATELDNRSATLFAQQYININANGNLNNQGANLTSAKGIIIDVDDLNNHTTTLNTEGELSITASNIDNQEAVLNANQMTINTNKLQNQYAKMTIGSLAKIISDIMLNNAATIKAENIDISANILTGDGKLLAENNIDLNLQERFVNKEEIFAKKQLSIKVNQISNEGKLSAGNSLKLDNILVENAKSGQIESSNILIKGNSVNNKGLINGDFIEIRLSNELNNNDSAQLVGDVVTIFSKTLNNSGSSLSTEIAPMLRAKKQLTISTNILNNTNRALLLSQGTMDINTTTLNNHSARIESHDDMNVLANTINNIDDALTFEEMEIKKENVKEYSLYDSNKKYSVDEVNLIVNPKKHHRNYILQSTTGEFKDTDRFYEYVYERVTYTTKVTNMVPAEIISGKNMHIDVTQINNANSTILAAGELNMQETIVNNSSIQDGTRQKEIGWVTYHYPIKTLQGEVKGSSSKYYEAEKNSLNNSENLNISGHVDVVLTDINLTLPIPAY